MNINGVTLTAWIQAKLAQCKSPLKAAALSQDLSEFRKAWAEESFDAMADGCYLPKLQEPSGWDSEFSHFLGERAEERVKDALVESKALVKK